MRHLQHIGKEVKSLDSDIKSTVAGNIVKLRTANNMTQLELAKRLNYSDKAVSKWERAESLPDISTLIEISELFEVSLDDLVKNEEIKTTSSDELKKETKFKRTMIVAIIIVLVWFCALFAFVMISLIAHGSITWHWITFIYAVPISTIVWLIFNSIWSKPRLNYIIISLLVWSGLATVFITLLLFKINAWEVFLLGVPAQIAIVLWSMMKKKKR